MAVKSVIDIEVNDEAFQNFKRLFEKYEEAVAGSNDNWKRTEQETMKVRKTFGQMVKDLIQNNRATNDAKKNTKDLVGFWERISSSSRTFAGNVASATGTVAKWGSIVGGVLGIGGFMGIDTLAHIVGQGRRASMGLGMTYGERKSFQVNYGRLLDPDALITGVSEALGDVTKRFALYGAGLTEQDMRGKDTGQVAMEVIDKLKPLVNQTPSALLGQLLTSRGLGQLGFTVEDLRRLKATSPQELAQYKRDYAADLKTSELQGKVQQQWQDLSRRLSSTGLGIESVFVKGLGHLVPGINSLSASVQKAIETILAVAEKRHWLEELGDGLDKFANYVASPKFQNDVHSFVENVADLSQSIVNALRFLHLIPESPSAPENPMNKPPDISMKAHGEVSSLAEKGLTFGGRWALPKGMGELHSSMKSNLFQTFAAGGWGQDPNHAAAMIGNWMAESGGRADVWNRGGANRYGLEQWDPQRRAQFKMWVPGHYDMTDPRIPYETKLRDEMAFSLWELFVGQRKHSKRFLNAKTIQEAVLAFAQDIERASPKELQSSMGTRLKAALSVKSEVHVKVSNPAGGNVVTTTAQTGATKGKAK